jgi:hypothetical protein
VIRDWFEGYFAALDARQRLEIINPVQTKVHKYLGNRVRARSSADRGRPSTSGGSLNGTRSSS